MSEQQPRQSYDDIAQNGPNSEQFDAMVRHSEMLNDPAREARMAEMGKWAELSGAMTEEQQYLFESAGKNALARELRIEEVREKQKYKSDQNSKRVFLPPDTSVGSTRTSAKNIERKNDSSIQDNGMISTSVYRSPKNIPS